MGIEKSTIINGNFTIQTYLRDGVNLPVSPIKEFIVIETGTIAGNTTKVLNLFLYNHTFMLKSIWVDIGANNNYSIEFKILWQNNPIFTFNLNNSQIPFSFPPVIITNDLTIEIKPTATIDKVLIYGVPCAIYDRLVFP